MDFDTRFATGSSFVYGPDTKDLCYKCNSSLKLFKCSRCKVARYCSTECQRAAWKSHKPFCKDHEAQMTDPDMQQDMKALLRWEELWRSTLETYALLAMDLPHREHPDDFLSTHTFIVQIERRPSQTSKAKLFKIKLARYIPDVEYPRFVHNMLYMYGTDFIQKQIATWKQLSLDTNNIIRQTLWCGNTGITQHSKALVDEIRMRNDGEMRMLGVPRPTNPGERILATKVMEGYMKRLMKDALDGKVQGFSEYLKEKEDEVVESSEIAYGVD